MTKQIFLIRTSDIVKLEKCSAATASRKLQQVRFCLNRKKGKPVTLKEYCQYYDFNIQDVITFLSERS